MYLFFNVYIKLNGGNVSHKCTLPYVFLMISSQHVMFNVKDLVNQNEFKFILIILLIKPKIIV